MYSGDIGDRGDIGDMGIIYVRRRKMFHQERKLKWKEIGWGLGFRVWG